MDKIIGSEIDVVKMNEQIKELQEQNKHMLDMLKQMSFDINGAFEICANNFRVLQDCFSIGNQ